MYNSGGDFRTLEPVECSPECFSHGQESFSKPLSNVATAQAVFMAMLTSLPAAHLEPLQRQVPHLGTDERKEPEPPIFQGIIDQGSQKRLFPSLLLLLEEQ